MKQISIFILMILTMLGFKVQSMEEEPEKVGYGNLPLELKLHILSFTKADNLIDLFKNLFKVSQSEKATYALSLDENLIKNLITTHIDEQLKNKSLEQIIPEVLDAKDFIQKNLTKDRSEASTSLLEVINKIYNPIVQDLSKKYLNLEGKSIEVINIELFLKVIKLKEINKVRLLLAAGANPNFEHPVFKDSVLVAAVTADEKEIADLLTKAGANVNARDGRGKTVLIISAFHNTFEITNILLAAGANPNIQQNKEERYTALMWAAANNNKAIMEALLNAGAKLDTKNADGETALGVAKRRNSKEAIDIINTYLQKKI